MPAPNPIIAVVRQWVVKAEHDLTAAARILKVPEDCPTDTVCFHAQQCAEKYLKALLVFRGTAFPKTHEIPVLRALLPPKLRPKLAAKLQNRLTAYAAALRYPGTGPEVPLTEARTAVAIARRVRKEVRKHLPRAALRRERK